MLIRCLLFIATLLIAGHAHSIIAEQAKGIATGESDTRVEALNKALPSADDKTAAFLQALLDDAVKATADKVFIIRGGKGFDPVSGAEVLVPEAAEDVINNNRMRGELASALAGPKLFSKDEAARRAGIKTLQAESDESRLPLIEKAFAAEQNAELKDQLGLIRAAVLLNSADKVKRLIAANLLAQSGQASTKTVLLERLKVETEPDVKAALAASWVCTTNSWRAGPVLCWPRSRCWC